MAMIHCRPREVQPFHHIVLYQRFKQLTQGRRFPHKLFEGQGGRSVFRQRRPQPRLVHHLLDQRVFTELEGEMESAMVRDRDGMHQAMDVLPVETTSRKDQAQIELSFGGGAQGRGMMGEPGTEFAEGIVVVVAQGAPTEIELIHHLGQKVQLVARFEVARDAEVTESLAFLPYLHKDGRRDESLIFLQVQSFNTVL